MIRNRYVILRITWDDGHDQDPNDWDWTAILDSQDVESARPFPADPNIHYFKTINVHGGY